MDEHPAGAAHDGRHLHVVPLDVERLHSAAVRLAVVLVAVGVGTTLTYELTDRRPDRLHRYLDVNAEGNLPTWCSVVLLAAAAAATWWIAHLHRHAARPVVGARWTVLAALIALLSLDEMTSLHEASGRALRSQVEVPVLGKYAWIVPGTIAAALLGRVLFVAVQSMTGAGRRALVRAGVLFVSAALGIEVLEALLLNDGRNYLGTGMHVLTGTQELLEMLAVMSFLRAALGEVARLSPPVSMARSREGASE